MSRSRFIPLVWWLLPIAAASFTSCIRVPTSPDLKRLEVRAKATEINRPMPVKIVPGREPDVLVWLLADDLHTGMVFEYDWLVENGFRPPANFPKAKYVTMSWGNRQAYVQKAWLTPWQAVRAMCTPSPSVMEMIPFDYNVVDVCHFQHVWRKLVPRERGPVIAEFLNDCLRHQADDRPLVIGTSSWGKGVLLDSPHSYMIPRVCNIWTVQCIEACGGEVHPWGAMTRNGVIKQAEKNGYQKIWDAYDKKEE